MATLGQNLLSGLGKAIGIDVSADKIPLFRDTSNSTFYQRNEQFPNVKQTLSLQDKGDGKKSFEGFLKYKGIDMNNPKAVDDAYLEMRRQGIDIPEYDQKHTEFINLVSQGKIQDPFKRQSITAETLQTEDKNILSQFGENIKQGVGGAVTTVGGAISQLPEIAGNIAKVGTEYNPVLQVADRLQALITGERELSGLAETYQKQGQEAKKELQKSMGLNPEDWKVKIGEFIAEMSPFFAGGKITKGIEGIEKLNKLKTSFPKLYKLAETVLAGGLGTELYTTTSEGRLATNPELGVGITAQGAFNLAGGLVNKIKSAISPETKDLIMKGIKPRLLKGRETPKQMQNFENDVISGFGSIVKNKDNIKLVDDYGDEIVGQLPKNLNQAVDAVEQTQNSLFNQYNNILKQKGQNLEFNFDDIISELNTLKNNKSIQLASPNTIKYIDDMIENYKNVGYISSDEIQQLKQGINNKLKAYYRNPNPNELGNVMVDTMINNQLGNKLNNSIGDEYTALKKQYGALANIKSDLIHRATVEGRKGQVGLFDLANIFNAGDVISGLTSGNIGQVVKGTAQTFLTSLAKKLNSPDRNIKLLFERLDNELKPIPNWIQDIIPLDTGKAIKETYQKGPIGGKPLQKKGFAVNPFSKGEKLPEVTNELIKEAKKYKSAEEFIEAQHSKRIEGQRGWSAPSGKGVSLEERLSYDGDVTLREELTHHIKQPDDYFNGYLGPKKYGNDSNTITAIKKGMSEGKIKIYRAVPKNINTWRDGDWVYFVKEKAQIHGDKTMDGNYHIIEKTVPIDDVWWDGNDINEWGYDSGLEEKQLKKIWEQVTK